MATLNVWNNFSKRKNSTKQPTGTADLSLDVKLKEETSLANPSFIVTGDRFTANYAQYGGVYYYIDDIVSLHNGLCEIKCSKDVLATYKANIQAASLYVKYYTHNNTEISDRRLSTKTTQVTQSKNGAFDYFGAGMTTVLFAVGKDHIAAYKSSMLDIKRLISTSFFDKIDQDIGNVPAIDTSSVENAISDAGRFLTDLLTTTALSATYVGTVADCIRNVYLLPIDPAAWGGSLHDIYIGKCVTQDSLGNPIQGYELGPLERILHDSASVQIPWQASDWRRNAPYHEIYLYIPCIGMTSISPSDVIGETTIYVDLSLDKISGDAIFNVGTGSKVIAQYTTNVAVNYPIGSSNVDPAKVINSIGNAVSDIAGGGNVISGALQAGLGLANAITPQPMSIGSNGGGAFLGLVGYTGNKVYCFTVFHDTTVSPGSVSAVKGTPYNGVMSLSGVSGYVETEGASVELPGFGPDKDEVNSFLNGGIYIE